MRTSTRPQISRAYVEDHRRRRYVMATAELLHEFGRHQLTVTNVVRLARTARNSYYEVFGGSEDCIAWGIELACTELFATLDAQPGDGEWLAEVHEAIAGFYVAAAAEPLLAELLLVHSATSRSAAGQAAARRGAERFTAILRRGREQAGAAGRRLPVTSEEYFSRAIASLAARRSLEDRLDGLPAESGPIALTIGSFYLGPARAQELLAAARPRAAAA